MCVAFQPSAMMFSRSKNALLLILGSSEELLNCGGRFIVVIFAFLTLGMETEGGGTL